MVEFMTVIKGRANHTDLPELKYLWSLFETIVNTIQSIEESGIVEGGEVN